MLEKKDYGQGLISYCHYDNGFFNKEGEFVEEGSSYWDNRYKGGFKTSIVFYSSIFAAAALLFVRIFLGAPYLYSVLMSIGVLALGIISGFITYFKLKKEHWFRDTERQRA
jgi:hypothetical protein